MTTPEKTSVLRKVGPFLWVGGAWGLLGAVASTIGMIDPLTAVAWNSGIWILCMFDFFGTALMVRGMISVRAGDSAPRDESPASQALGGLALKLACFGLLGVVLWAGKEAPLRALLLGLATMLIVPIAGGLFWFQKERLNG